MPRKICDGGGRSGCPEPNEINPSALLPMKNDGLEIFCCFMVMTCIYCSIVNYETLFSTSFFRSTDIFLLKNSSCLLQSSSQVSEKTMSSMSFVIYSIADILWSTQKPLTQRSDFLYSFCTVFQKPKNWRSTAKNPGLILYQPLSYNTSPSSLMVSSTTIKSRFWHCMTVFSCV